MQLVHVNGWRLSPIPSVDGGDGCYRLCRDRIWVHDCPAAQLADLLTGHGVTFDDFAAAHVDCCVMVDPSTRIACLRPAEPVDGQGHLPLCGLCRQSLAAMYGFPRPRNLPAPAEALPHLSALWHGLGTEQHRHELSHHIRHPIAKILGWAEILRDDDTLDPQQVRQLQVIYRSARDLQQILDHVASPL
ncbi:hypothetical protein BJY16_007371 [Actinoplanes octamycinicus]|uniref:histidine kinase n=1 Tax=Actinoplanes octamycinicus TaxID=135948 RepID=A0A7W7MBD8_9ACTN|nr:histidine kinase dimerization/phospho-acceptor domain-containing protein [Actinoplanes octamycinicus]MBB4743912.1 hypothetical protein [Actinoplanes octamycinicus]GIE58539.1 hypothetical protein Aoc01nite_39410 [Actinoplanes octamycinicus]